MKIINHINNKYQELNKENNIKTGSILNFTLKEKLSKDTAIINIDGKDIKAKFNKGLTGVDDSKGRIQIKSINSDVVSVDYVEAGKIENNTDVLNKLQGIEEKELELVMKELKDEGIKLSNKDMDHIIEFIKNDNSSLSKKIDIINRLVKKDIDITFKNIISLKEALFGDGIDLSMKNVIESLNLQSDTTILQNEENSIRLEPSDDTKDVLSERILERLNNENKSLYNSVVSSDLEIKEENDLDLSAYPDDILAMETSSQKKILMIIVSEKMNSINENFKDLKSTVIRNLDKVIFDNTLNKEDIKQSLENSLDYLNRKILKSDITLYTDMLTEKKLIKISSKIDLAKNLISKNNIVDGKELINEIKEDLNKIEFKASEEKMIYGISDEINRNINGEKSNSNSLLDFLKNPPSGSRQAYDYIKGLGLNYENDILNDELFNLNNKNLEKNLKGNLLKIMTQGNKDMKDISSVVKVLDNLNGQQLLNKVERNNSVQTMFFDIPINLVGKIENMKLFINSNKETEKLDWKNSSLYFLIETTKLGETGILINARNKNLEITIKNDDDIIKKKIASLEDKFIDKLKDIGYNVNGIKYDEFSKEENKTNILDRSIKSNNDEFNFHRKGLDIRI